MTQLKSLKSLFCSTLITATLSLSALTSTHIYAHDHHDHGSAALEKAAAGEHRSAKNKARDQYRHPVETLAFFGFSPEMTVVEKLCIFKAYD